VVYLWIALGTAGVGLRQVDRWRFANRRGGLNSAESIPAILERQRGRANNLTPALLLAGHWLEVAAWWGWGARSGPMALVAVAAITAVKLRHLQEASHFAAHGVLFRSMRAGDAITGLAVHAPLGYVPVAERRERHVRRHHPNAAIPGVDPNLDALTAAGLRPGASLPAFITGVLYPLTPRGVLGTLRSIDTSLRMAGVASAAVFFLVPATAFALGGTRLLIAGYLIPRILLYPQLAWTSLLVEHTWFEPVPLAAGRGETEAARCVRVYRRKRVSEIVARCVWLPYGDLYHYAHSAHPSVRWNYLPRVEELIGYPRSTPARVAFGKDSVLASLHRATRGTGRIGHPAVETSCV